jgi:polyphosphate kinase
VQLVDAEHVSYISSLLDLYLADSTAHWTLENNGKWLRVSQDSNGVTLLDAQEQLIKRKNLRGN